MCCLKCFWSLQPLQHCHNGTRSLITYVSASNLTFKCSANLHCRKLCQKMMYSIGPRTGQWSAWPFACSRSNISKVDSFVKKSSSSSTSSFLNVDLNLHFEAVIFSRKLQQPRSVLFRNKFWHFVEPLTRNNW